MTAKKALGRGLDAIFGEHTREEKSASRTEQIGNIPVAGAISDILLSQINTNPDQPRKEFDEDKLIELSDSIKNHGIIQPVTVRKTAKNKFELITGERRYRASKMAGLKSIPAFIREADDVQVMEMALVENIQRQDLNAIEIAFSYQKLVDECNLSYEELSKRVGKKRATVNNYLRLLKLPIEIQLALKEELVSMGHARALISMEDITDQLFVLKETIEKELSVRQVEAIVRKIQNKELKLQKKPLSLPYKYQQLNSKVKKKLNVAVEIKRNNKGKGKISIEFDSDKKLDQILNEILNS
ncbi:MAG: ParB/RepB/Spo0J family partition protein [Bacteroidales bacterium]|nr:ParB/RepB/Spo0J family partition protein [Bacteroidales bacterium]